MDHSRPDLVSTLFIWVFLMLGLILTPFVRCGQALGCVDPSIGRPTPPPDCPLRTQALCDKDKQNRIDHPYWYEDE